MYYKTVLYYKSIKSERRNVEIGKGIFRLFLKLECKLVEEFIIKLIKMLETSILMFDASEVEPSCVSSINKFLV